MMAYASIKHWAAVGLIVLVELSAEKVCSKTLNFCLFKFSHISIMMGCTCLQYDMNFEWLNDVFKQICVHVSNFKFHYSGILSVLLLLSIIFYLKLNFDILFFFGVCGSEGILCSNLGDALTFLILRVFSVIHALTLAGC